MDDTFTLKKSLITEALEAALDKANVPQRQHLMVVQALQRRMAEHQKDMQTHQKMLGDFESTLKQHESTNQNHERQISEWDELSKHLTSIEHLQGEQGEPGLDGMDGVNGEDADDEAILNKVLTILPNFIPDPIPGKDAEFDEEALTQRIISKIQKEKSLDLTHIKGAQSFIKDGVRYKFEELMHGGGSSSGSGLNYLIATGVINNTNTVFTFTKQPTFVIVNGASYVNGSGVTIAGTTATLDNPAGIGGAVTGLG